MGKKICVCINIGAPQTLLEDMGLLELEWQVVVRYPVWMTELSDEPNSSLEQEKCLCALSQGTGSPAQQMNLTLWKSQLDD